MRSLFTLLSLCVCAISIAQKSYIVNYIEGITIDGNLSDWEQVSFTDEFVDHGLGTITTNVQTTQAKVAWDSDNLYFMFVSSDVAITASQGSQDDPIFSTDDLVEVFIDADGNGVDYIEIGANAQEVYYDYILECVTSSCGGWKDNQGFDLVGVEVKSSYDGTLNNNSDVDVQYVIEMKVPFSSLNAIPDGGFTTPTDGDSWNANLFRVDVGSSTEYLSWNPHNSFGFHQPSKFGKLVFTGGPLTSLHANSNSVIEVYPNPTQGVINFSTEVSSVKVYNTFGKLVFTEGGIKAIDLADLGQGVYVCNILVDAHLITEKIIVE